MTKSSTSTIITNINHKGFELIYRNKSQRYFWKDFNSVAFDKTKHKVILKKSMFQKVILSDYFEGWYCIIRKIPKQFNEFDFQFVETFFSSLRTCKTCGNIAVYKGSCHNCGSEAWNRILADEYESEYEYLREEQFDHFAIYDENDTFEGFYLHNPCFHFDSNWKPLISQYELKLYCEEHYWA